MRAWKNGIAIAVVVCAVSAFVFILSRALFGFGDTSNVTSPTYAASTAATSSLPARIYIPTLSIDANVQHVGVAKSGAMAVPNNFTDVGWFRGGTVPGQVGSAVVDGHVDNGLALPGVFKHLDSIKIGDSLYIETAKGDRLHFVVYDVEWYPYKDVPVDGIFQKNDAAYLNLITCGGSWVRQDKTYNQRLVVYSKFVGT